MGFFRGTREKKNTDRERARWNISKVGPDPFSASLSLSLSPESLESGDLSCVLEEAKGLSASSAGRKRETRGSSVSGENVLSFLGAGANKTPFVASWKQTEPGVCLPPTTDKYARGVSFGHTPRRYSIKRARGRPRPRSTRTVVGTRWTRRPGVCSTLNRNSPTCRPGAWWRLECVRSRESSNVRVVAGRRRKRDRIEHCERVTASLDAGRALSPSASGADSGMRSRLERAFDLSESHFTKGGHRPSRPRGGRSAPLLVESARARRRERRREGAAFQNHQSSLSLERERERERERENRHAGGRHSEIVLRERSANTPAEYYHLQRETVGISLSRHAGESRVMPRR